MKTNDIFTKTKQNRDLSCQGKDTVILPILKGITINNPMQFKALLMPSMYGPEAYYLISKGVPPKNIYVIEQDSATHAEIIACSRKDRKELKGISTTAYPMSAQRAIHRAKAHNPRYHLVYLDFFGQPEYKIHYKHIIKAIFVLDMLADDSTLILNFGRIRSRRYTAELNKKLLKIESTAKESLPTSLMIRAAIKETSHRDPKLLKDVSYGSVIAGKMHQYITTVTTFSS